MIFIYNNTDARLGMKTTVDDAREVGAIRLVVTDDAGQNDTEILTSTNRDVIDTLSGWGTSYEDIHKNPFKTNVIVPNEQRTVINEKDEIEVFSLSNKDDENRKLPRVILFVITGKDAEVYTDGRNVYKAIESVVVGEYKVTKLLIKWGRWSSLRIKTFVSIVDGDTKKKLQLVGVQTTNKTADGKDVTYTSNSLDISEMTEEEYQAIKNNEIPKFGKDSLLIIGNGEKKAPEKNTKTEYRKKEYPNKKRANHGHGNDNGKFNGSRGKSFHGNNKSYNKGKGTRNR